MLELLDLMIKSQYSSQATIRIAPATPTALWAVNGPSKLTNATELTFRHAKTKVGPAHWTLVANTARIVITLGTERLNEVRSGIMDVLQGRGDWAAPNDDEVIDEKQLWYFWPLVSARGVQTLERFEPPNHAVSSKWADGD